jgi:hypothetical protein
VRWLVVVVIAGGWVMAGWQNMPRAAQPYPAAAGLAIGLTCAVCWWAGRRSGRAGSFASAYASAEARANAAAMASSTATNAVFVQVGDGARHRAAASLGGLDNAEWIERPRAMLEQDTADQYAEELFGVQEVREAQETA